MSHDLPAFCYRSVSVIALTLCLAHPVNDPELLQPRAEVNVRAGTERSILMTEFWAPLAQQSDRVLYGDLRLIGDNDENKEASLVFGYRQINPKFNSVLGASAWIDPRRTERGNNFHQITLGVESLGERIDLRSSINVWHLVYWSAFSPSSNHIPILESDDDAHRIHKSVNLPENPVTETQDHFSRFYLENQSNK